MFVDKSKPERKVAEPVKFEDYWDMNIPTEFYEEEFLEFEKYMHFTGNIKKSTKENPYANYEYYLERFKNYEKFMKKENTMQIRRQDKKKKKDIGKKGTKIEAAMFTGKRADKCTKVNDILM